MKYLYEIFFPDWFVSVLLKKNYLNCLVNNFFLTVWNIFRKIVTLTTDSPYFLVKNLVKYIIKLFQGVIADTTYLRGCFRKR